MSWIDIFIPGSNLSNDMKEIKSVQVLYVLCNNVINILSTVTLLKLNYWRKS